MASQHVEIIASIKKKKVESLRQGNSVLEHVLGVFLGGWTIIFPGLDLGMAWDR